MPSLISGGQDVNLGAHEPYNYQMGLGQDYGTYDSPGVLTDRIAEQNQRGFYQRWAAYMDA
jgi:hypothetical protein